MPSYFVNEASQDVFVPAVDWEEELAMEQPGGGASFSQDGGEATLVGSIPFNKMRSARNQILGYQWADSGSPWALHREPPWRSPDFPEMRATDVHFAGYNPLGVAGNPNNKPYVSAAVPTGVPSRRVRYTRARTTVRFKPHPFLFLTDTELAGAGEMNRCCTIFDTLDPSLELLMADTNPSTAKFVEGPYSGTAFPAPLPEYIAKCLFVIAWWSVPIEFIANPYLPSKIMSCVGYVNGENDWLNGGITGAGFPKGTLLLEAPRIRMKLQPIWTINDQSPRIADVFLPFKWVDPRPAPDIGTSPLYRGWNLFPFSRVGDTLGAYWYSVGRGGDPGAPIFGFKTFTNLFTHVSSPALP